MASRVVSGLGTGASLALVTTAGSFGVEPTTDRALVLAEIDRFLDKFDPEGRRLYPRAQMPNPGPIIGAAGPVVERGPKHPARFFGDMGAFRTLQDVAKKLQANGGRRNAFVWISGGMDRWDAPSVARCEDPNAPAFHCGALAGLLDALQRANVANRDPSRYVLPAAKTSSLLEVIGRNVVVSHQRRSGLVERHLVLMRFDHSQFGSA